MHLKLEMMRPSSEIWLKMTLVFCLLFAFFAVNAQSFRKKEIRDFQKMKNNYGNAVADYDLDGDLDVFIVAFDPFDPNLPQTWSRLLKNSGNGGFEDVTVEAGFRIQSPGSITPRNKIGASWGDYDNDGYPDLFLTHTGSTQLYRNEGNGKFRDVSAASQIAPCTECFNNGSIWWDYNNDKYLDIYISDFRNPNLLYRNRGDGTFENVTNATGLGDAGATWSSLPFDANKDGWQDLLVLNDFGLSNFYESIQGNSFVNKTKEYGLENKGDAMGGTVGDCNNDGHFDIYITNISEFQPNPLFMGTDSGPFVNRAEENRVEVGHWAWGTHFFDADHDGDEDLYLVNGWPGFDHNNKFFKNLYSEGRSGFVDWSEQSSTNGASHGMSTEVFDYDNDGDLDILVSNTNDSPYFYENIGAPGRNWLQVELEGKASNRNAFGAVVSAWAGNKFFQRFHHGTGIMMQSVKPVHIGLGSVSVVDSLIIDWPGGHREIFYGIEPDQKIKIVENTGLVSGTTVITSASDVDHLNDHGLKVYPTPFTELLNIEFDNSIQGRLKWKVYTMEGKYILGNQESMNSNNRVVIDLSGEVLRSGVYYLALDLEGVRYSLRVIKAQ